MRNPRGGYGGYMWLCTNWIYDADAIAAFGTWAAVVVALGIALASSISRWRQRRVEARLLAVSLYHEVVNANAILEGLSESVMPRGDGGLIEAILEMDATIRKDVAFHIDRILLPGLEKSANRLSVLPRETAIAVGELQSNLSFLAQDGRALATGNEPPADFYPELCANVQACVSSATAAQQLLKMIAFPNGRQSA